MDHRHGLFEDDLTLEECLERVQVLFYDESTNSESPMSLNYLDELLSKLHQPSHQSTTVTRRVASFVRDVATFHPNACHLLLIHLPQLLDPIPFIEIMPSMFCIASPSLVVEAATQLKILPERDCRLLLPVLCAMADLHLTGSLLDELYSLAEEAIGTLEEAELPALFRAILKSLCPLRAERAMLRLRDEVSISLILSCMECC
jgi:hypothetical protein